MGGRFGSSATSVEDVVRDMRRSMLRLATGVRAEKEKQYLKSDLEHLGVTMPEMRKVAKASLKTYAATHDGLDEDSLWALVNALWERPVHELRAAAVEMLVARPKLLVEDHLPRLEQLIRESKTWALVDPLAITVVGGLVARFEPCRDRMDTWARDSDFWVRRSAMLALLGPLRRGGGDFERFSGYADAMLEEKEFFIRKAIGWVLRETSKKRPELVRDWIAPRIDRASGVTVREAVKYLPEKNELMDRYRAARRR
jgi:3-methyladenine DNA glycosylase AlkD